MASISAMIDLKNFPKLGVRVPVALKRRVRQLALDMETEGIAFPGGEITMEAIFAVATLALFKVDRKGQVEAFRTQLPELLAMFEAESPVPAQENPPGEAGDEKKSRPMIADNPGSGSLPRKSRKPRKPKKPKHA